jgi:hypothetical protein
VAKRSSKTRSDRWPQCADIRAACREYLQLLGVMPLSPEQKARLAELNAIIETERQC